MKNIILFDLDGTLALIDNRLNLSSNSDGKIDWDIFFDPENIKLDIPNEPVVKISQLLNAGGYKIIIFSGRSDKTFDATQSWLKEHKIPYHKLIMRDSKKYPYISDDILKKQMLNKHLDINDVFLVFDDRNKVVDMWRKNGLTCMQVAPGNF